MRVPYKELERDLRASGRPKPLSERALKAATVGWFVCVAIGQAIFASYIAIFYGGSSLAGHFERWNEVIPGRVVEGDVAGFAMIAAHLILAFVVTVCGPLQLTPAIRGRFPRFHRLNGRIYITSAFLMGLGGLWLIWGRREADDTLVGSLPLTINAVLLILFASVALNRAMKRRIDEHRQWALRLFVAMSGVWYLRVIIPLWVTMMGFEGLGERLEGPVGTALKFGAYALPLLVLEIVFWAQKQAGPGPKLATAGLVSISTLATAVGIAMAFMFFWRSHMGF